MQARLIFAILSLTYSFSAGAVPTEAPHALVDEAIRAIMSTPTGQRALCPFTETAETMELYIGGSSDVDARMQALCAGRYTTPVTRQIVRAMSARFLSEGPQTPGKRFYSLGYSSEYKDIESYTNKANATFFMMTPQEMTGVEFIRAVAHEYAMSYDQLARLGYLNDPTTWEQGLNAAYGRPLYTVDTVFEKVSNVFEISCAIRDPALRYALGTERAFRFEDRVVQELGLTAQSPAVASANFSVALRRLLKLYTKFPDLIAWEQMKYEVACGKLATGAARVEQIAKRARLLDNTVLKYNGSQKTMRLSDLLLEVHVGPFMRDLDGGGPRPRGSGWGDGE